MKPGFSADESSKPRRNSSWVRRPIRLCLRSTFVEAGAEFVQTQFCFDLNLMRRYMAAVRDLGLHERVFILAGVGPLRSARTAEWLRARVPGVVIPDEVIQRLRSVSAERQREEGKRLCVEIIQELQDIEGVSGVHVMAYRQEELVAEIIEESGLLPRRQAGRNVPVVEREDASS
jgi:methylenetetrahydrofolate reductase (NADPH)